MKIIGILLLTLVVQTGMTFLFDLAIGFTVEEAWNDFFAPFRVMAGIEIVILYTYPILIILAFIVLPYYKRKQKKKS